IVARSTHPTELKDYYAVLHPIRLFLEHAGDGGIGPTQSGEMTPKTVTAASAVVPDQDTWYGKNNRENLAVHVLDFREALQRVKLLRKYKRKLLPTRRAAAAGTDPRALWELLVEALIPPKD